jgi:hypothetical protein
MTITDVDLNEIGEIADMLDNLLAATELPMPPVFHLQQVKAGMRDISKQLKEIVIRISGDNPWES